MADQTKKPAAPHAEDKAAHAAEDHGLLARLVLAYWKPAAIAALVALAGSGGMALYEKYQASRIAGITEKIGKIAAEKTGPDRLADLKALLAEAPSGAREGVLLEMAKAAQDAGDLPAAALAWEDLSKSSDGAVRSLAELGQAAILTKTGDTAKALQILEKARGTASKPFLLAIDRQMAVTAEAAGDLKAALTGYERMKSESSMQNMSYIDSKIEALRAKIEAGGQKSNG
ncbi:tetratricopeptide repeat protein [Desulfolutivibrio sp.]|uniref:tetratricopeptide repeat protein n=1 Tax=Desulfolutivibrio sp. TaxID=2773296 RepID=UPI002F9616DE